MVKTMDQAQQEEQSRKAKEYEKYVKEKTPTHSLTRNMLGAFLSGGMICTLGQVIMNICKSMGMDKEISGSWTSLILILLSVLLTGWNLYPKLAKWGGAGTLVPITGFANSVACLLYTSNTEILLSGSCSRATGRVGCCLLYTSRCV